MRPAVALVALLFVVACGSNAAPVADAAGLLAASAVPGVPYTTTVLTVSELSKDAAIPGLESMFSSWGYVDGAERTFQGQSHHLTYVLSRSLAFHDSAGALAYVAFVHDNTTAYFGVAGVQELTAQGRPGWQFTPAACACHMANPVEVGVVSNGSTVSWLEINGPDASPALLLSLLDPTNSVH